MSNNHDHPNTTHDIPIFIDEVKYELSLSEPVTGAQLRALVPVSNDRDLWLEIPGPNDDILIKAELPYKVKAGSHFYTVPSTINPGGN